MTQLFSNLFSGIYSGSGGRSIEQETFKGFKEDLVSAKKIKDIKQISNSINKESPESISKALEEIAKFLDDNDSVVKSYALVTLLKIVIAISKSSKPGGAFENHDPKDLKKLLKALTKLCNHQMIKDNTECRSAFENAIKNLSTTIAKALSKEEDKFLTHDYLSTNRLSDKNLELIRKGLKTATGNVWGGLTKEKYLQTINQTKDALIGTPNHTTKMYNGSTLTLIGEA